MINLTLIAAVAKNRVIGNEGEVPWKIPEDMKRFRDLTMGHPVIMGRKTYDSIPERFRPLPGRTNIVVSRTTSQEDYPEEVILCDTVYKAIESADGLDEDCYVIGGGQIYEHTIGLARRLEITHVNQEPEGDAFFPHISSTAWEEVNRQDREGYSFVTYDFRG